jgi:hypothetical protein
VALGVFIAGAATALCFHSGHQRNTNIETGLKARHVEELDKRYKAELENDRMERETEAFVWDAPIGLAQQRVLIALELADDLQEQKVSSWRNDPPNPGIALEKAALARIDARLQQLKSEAATASMEDQTAQR